jgi:hypothetical protein
MELRVCGADSERRKLGNGETSTGAADSPSITGGLFRRLQHVAPVRTIANYLWPSSAPAVEGPSTSQPQQHAAPPLFEPTAGTSAACRAGE